MAWVLSAFADEAGSSADVQIAALRQAQLHYIDIRSIDGHNISDLPLDAARAVRAKLDAAGITVNMFGSPLGKIDLADEMKIDLDKLRHMAQLKDILGCNAVRIFSYYNRKAGLPAEQFQRRALERLGELRKLAADTGMVLYHENEAAIFGDKVRDVLTITQHLRDGKTFRMIFDFGNYNHGHEDVWANWLLLRDTTDAFHLKDSVWQEGKMHHVPVGRGAGWVPEILRDAVGRHWAGPLSVEPHLQHSQAVVATGASGVPNQAYAQMTQAETFQVACRAAREHCLAAGATLA